MKAGWLTKTLGDIADVKGGKRVPKGYKLLSEPTEHPYITVSDFTDDGTIDSSEIRYISHEVFEQIKRYTISSKDLYLSIAGTIGKTGYVPLELDGANLTENACKLVLHPNIDRDFVYYFSQSNEFILQAGTNTRTAAQPKLALERLKTIKLTIPESLPEQQRIVSILDEAFDGIATAKANAEKNLQNARTLFESHLQSVFSQRGEEWVEKTIGDIAQVKGGKRVPKGYKLLTEQTGFPYLRVTDFNDFGSIDTSDLRYISPQVQRAIKNYVICSRDLYISIAGTIGKTGIIPQELDGANLTENACRLVFKPNISNRFVYYFTQTADFIEQTGLNTRTAAQPKLALSRLSTTRLGIPSLTEQERHADQFDALRDETQRLESIYQQKLAALDELKKSLLHQAFSGEL